jgi:hypothetical protein
VYSRKRKHNHQEQITRANQNRTEKVPLNRAEKIPPLEHKLAPRVCPQNISHARVCRPERQEHAKHYPA